jgi:hypothetical protein
MPRVRSRKFGLLLSGWGELLRCHHAYQSYGGENERPRHCSNFKFFHSRRRANIQWQNIARHILADRDSGHLDWHRRRFRLGVPSDFSLHRIPLRQPSSLRGLSRFCERRLVFMSARFLTASVQSSIASALIKESHPNFTSNRR